MSDRERLYSIFHNMKSRCYLPSFSRYNYYGGRGIKICKNWKLNFNSFYEWAIQNGYKKGLTIDRIDNDKDYSPENCRWVAFKEQNNNTRKNHYYTYKNETKSISQWADIYGLHRCVLNNRIRRGWSFEQAIKTPTKRYSKRRNNEKI